MNDKNSKKNAEGYTDLTAYDAIKNIEQEEALVNKLLKTIYMICEMAGYRVESRIVFKNVKTGRIWR